MSSYSRGDRTTNWFKMTNAFGRKVLEQLGFEGDRLPGDANLVTRALADDAEAFVANARRLTGFSKANLARIATLCQMAVFDRVGGPEGDSRPKALRRHWYAWFKSGFAQPLAFALGEFERNAQGVKEIDDLSWTQLLSVTYADFVDTGLVTYLQLWVEDASRMMEQIYSRLFRNLNILVCVEKDSLFRDFVAPAKALGAAAVYSGKGKSSKAAIEKVLREHFGWSETNDPFEYGPLFVLHVSDYDFDGEQVIGPTFAEQARRYTKNIYEARIGVMPEQVSDMGHDLGERWYSLKVSNSGYQSWAEQKALFMATCVDCGHNYPVVGIDGQECPECGGAPVELSVRGDTPHGFEVESLKTRDYRRLMVDALLSILPFEIVVDKLRRECRADAWDAVQSILSEVYEQNEDYQRLLAEFERLSEVKANFESQAQEALVDLANPHTEDFRDLEDDPEPDDFRNYVAAAGDYSEAWRPFSVTVRTEALTKLVRDENQDEIDRLVNLTIEF